MDAKQVEKFISDPVVHGPSFLMMEMTFTLRLLRTSMLFSEPCCIATALRPSYTSNCGVRPSKMVKQLCGACLSCCSHHESGDFIRQRHRHLGGKAPLSHSQVLTILLVQSHIRLRHFEARLFQNDLFLGRDAPRRKLKRSRLAGRCVSE